MDSRRGASSWQKRFDGNANKSAEGMDPMIYLCAACLIAWLGGALLVAVFVAGARTKSKGME